MTKENTLTRCAALFYSFAAISSVSLGGGLVMLPVMQKEFVDKRHWLSENDMLDTIALVQSLPGIIAVNMSSILGYRIAGIFGALSATLGVVLPPFLTIVCIAYFLFNFMELAAIQHVFFGIRAGVCAMIFASVCKLGKKNLTGAFEIIVALVGFFALLLFNANILWLIAASALAGIAFTAATLLRARKAAAGGDGSK